MAEPAQDYKWQRVVRMGVGEAVHRLITIHVKRTQGVKGPAMAEEERLITEALNQYDLDLSFDCNEDGVPDTIEIFEATSATSCCRMIPFKSDRRKAPAPEPAVDLVTTEAPKPKTRKAPVRKKAASAKKTTKTTPEKKTPTKRGLLGGLFGSGDDK